MSYIDKIKKDNTIYNVRDSRVDSLSTTNETIISYDEMKTVLETIISFEEELENHTYTAYFSKALMEELWESLDAEAIEKIIAEDIPAIITVNESQLLPDSENTASATSNGHTLFSLSIETDTEDPQVVVSVNQYYIKFSIITFDSSLWPTQPEE